jgi:hypothetical protein
MKSIFTPFLLILLLTLISAPTFGQDQNLATIVDETPQVVDIIFISKLGIMALLGVIAFVSYIKFRKTN